MQDGYEVKVKSVYGKPLGRLNDEMARAVTSTDIKRALQTLSRSVLARMRGGLQQTAYSPAAKAVLAAAVKIEIKSSSLVIKTTHPSFIPLVLGQKRQQMLWLTKSRAPIPIVLDSGKVIFRTATARSMASGRWVHPGRPSTGIVEKSLKEAKAVVRERLKQHIRDKIKRAFR
jgi:hypothetical protein